jgi:N-methylhydantoinase B/oxoprolinase/acetone carboxylase alpha subunit
VPDLVPAAYYAQSYVITLQTIDPERDRQVLVEIEVGGCGALADSDGASALAFGMHNNSNIPIEMIEQELPLTFLGYGLRPDSGGAGRRRGGLGLWREWRIESAHAQLTTNLDRFRFPPFGLAGGEPGALSALYLVRDGERRALASKITNMMSAWRHRAAAAMARRPRAPARRSPATCALATSARRRRQEAMGSDQFRYTGS